MQGTSSLHCPWCGDNLTLQVDNTEEMYVVCETELCPKPPYSNSLWDALTDAASGELMGLLEEYVVERAMASVR